MNDRPGFSEQYGHATQSSNLRQVWHRITDPDRLMALALTDKRFASPAFRARVSDDAAQIRNVKALWRADVLRISQHRHWRVKMPVVVGPGKTEIGDVMLLPRHALAIADASLNAWLFDVCPACEGRKFETLAGDGEGRRVLSDRACIACNGTGKAAPEWLEPQDLMTMVQDCVQILRSRFEHLERRGRQKVGKA